MLTYSERGNVVQVVVHWANGQRNTIKASDIRSRFDVDSIRFTVNGAGTGGEESPEPTSEELYINGTGVGQSPCRGIPTPLAAAAGATKWV